MKVCPSCSKKMSDNSAFCDACGTSLENVEEEIEILEAVTTVPLVEVDTPSTVAPVNPPKKKQKKKNTTLKSSAVSTVPTVSSSEKPKSIPKQKKSEKEKKEEKVEEVEKEEEVEELTPTEKTVPPTTVPPTTVPPTTVPPTTVPPTTVPPTTVPPTTVPPTTVPPTMVPPTTVPPTTVPPTTVPPTMAPQTYAPAPVAFQQPVIPYQPSIEQEEDKIEEEIEAIEKSTKSIKRRIIVVFLVVLAIWFGLSLLLVSLRNEEAVSSKNKIFYGTNFTLKYDENWKVANMADGKEALKYLPLPAYLEPIGQSKLNETVECNFTKSSCRKKTYDEFYKYWKEDIEETMTLSKDSPFTKLKEDIYYASYNYTVNSTGELKGKYYLIISDDKNIVLSFVSSAEESSLGTIHQKIVELFKNIQLRDADEEDMGEMLVNMSSWNEYSDLRQDATARKRNIYGEFRILSDAESYWVFKNDEFWWYKDEKNLNDNYWYGSISVKTGKKGLKSIDIDEDKLDDIIQQSNGKVKAEDVYSIIMTPTKIITNGKDKSSTNISKNMKWKFVWIIVQHEDGIEAQVLNVDTSETSYFVKVKD